LFGGEAVERRPYANLGGDSGVRYYAIAPSLIRVWFKDGDSYEYDTRRPGRAHVEAMKRLAKEGRGLATYINQHVRTNYARKL
jgi:hypothetical protein